MDYSKLSDDDKQTLAGLCRIEIKRWKRVAKSNPNMRYMVELMEIALEPLTAEPVAYRRFLTAHPDTSTGYYSYSEDGAGSSSDEALYTYPSVNIIRSEE